MSNNPKRRPIDYPSAFGGGLLRPRDVVDQELAELDQTDVAPATAPDPVITPLPSPSQGQRATRQEGKRSGGQEESRKGGVEGRREGGKEDGERGTTLRTETRVELYDLNVKPYRKDSFNFTSEEFHELARVKLELRATYELQPTKDDIVRCALSYLLRDYRAQGEGSVLVQSLRRKRGK